MIEIRPLIDPEQKWGDQVTGLNQATSRIVYAESMDNSEYDRHGFRGEKNIVCADCLDDGKTIPVVRVREGTLRGTHFRHPPGHSPTGTERHGETAQHLLGKAMISEWAAKQSAVLEGSVHEEQWSIDRGIRSDVLAELHDGTGVAFEIQRRPLGETEWEVRRSRYRDRQILDIWVWAPHLGIPAGADAITGVVLDIRDATLGVMLAQGGYDFLHPSAIPGNPPASHYVATPLDEWGISAEGRLIPPRSVRRFLAPPVTEEPRSAPRVPLRRQHFVASSTSDTRFDGEDDALQTPATPQAPIVDNWGWEHLHAKYKEWRASTDRGRAETQAMEARLDRLLAKWRRERRYYS